MNSDFRAKRMPTPEGEGNAKDSLEHAWSTYYKVNKTVNESVYSVFPGLKDMLRGYAGSKVLDLFGFWLMWHLLGGFEGMQKALGFSRSNMFRRIAMFREVFGEHPDVFKFPGIDVDALKFAQNIQQVFANKYKKPKG